MFSPKGHSHNSGQEGISKNKESVFCLFNMNSSKLGRFFFLSKPHSMTMLQTLHQHCCCKPHSTMMLQTLQHNDAANPASALSLQTLQLGLLLQVPQNDDNANPAASLLMQTLQHRNCCKAHSIVVTANPAT